MDPAAKKSSLRERGFQSLLWTQALGAFNDNAFKTLIALMAVASMPARESARLIALAGALFVLPFIVFSTFAGTLADRFSKKKLVIVFKVVELALMALTFAALLTFDLPFLFALLLLMGTQSAFFGPVKLAILPEILRDKDLSRGNGLMQMMTFAGILAGTVAAGLLIERFRGQVHWACAAFVLVAMAGVAASLFIQDVPAAGGTEPLRLNFAAQTVRNLRGISRHRGVFLALMGAAYFWFVGAVLQMNLLVYGKELMGAGEATLSMFQVLVAVGIGAGSYLAGRLSGDRVELGLVPMGALGLVLFCTDLAFAYRCQWRAMTDLLLLGLSAGVFVVPLMAFVQQRAPEEERGKFIATGNVVSFIAVLIASAALWAFSNVFHLDAGQVFLVAAVMTLVVAGYILSMLPDFFLRLLLYPVTHLLYSIRVDGAENVPIRGPALLVANHVSHTDPAFITAALQRLVRFLMYRPYYELPVAHWFFRMMGCIPVSKGDSPKELVRSFETAAAELKRGQLVCIFAEGEITRHGQMLKFKKGFQHILKAADVPVIPVHLDRVWGSLFSFQGGRFLFKKPRRIPYPVTVSFGRPLRRPDAYGLRQAILELGADAFRHRLYERRPLPLAFMHEAKRHMRRQAVADSMGTVLSYGGLLAGARVLGRELVERIPERGRAGVLLPPSAGGVLTNIGLSLMGKVPVNLNYSSTRELALVCAEKAGAPRIVTSRRFLDKLGWEPDERMLFLEDVQKSVRKARAALVTAAIWLLPGWLLKRTLLRAAQRPLDSEATIMFTSGSTGSPKGVVLTHANILANIEAVAQVFQVTAEDRVLGVLPFFHSFGCTVTLWFPVVCGLGAVYHASPLDAKRIGRLAAEHKATFLLGTPTFLAGWLRRIEPAKLSSLRYVVVGAEKMRRGLADAFEERFGKKPLEGYGCTELSPVAAVNIPDFYKRGVPRQRGTKPGSIGHPLPGVLMKVVDPETWESLPAGESGLLLVKGPNVMKGYLDEPEKTAEVLRDGYYVTGDIAVMDEDGFVTVTDRLSRFSKIGGEMVPHVKLEDKLHELAGRIERTFVVTAVPDEKRGERLIVLYKDCEDIEGLHKRLEEAGLPKLWLPDRSAYRKVSEFPLLGSGKLDMKGLKAAARKAAS